MTRPRSLARFHFASPARALAIVVTTGLIAACSSPSSPPPEPPPAVVSEAADSLIITGTSPEDVTARTSAALFASSPAAVLVDATADLSNIDEGIPVLAVSPAVDSPTATPGVAQQETEVPPTTATTVGTELDRLGAETVLALGPTATAVAHQLGVEVVADPAGLPEFERAEPEPETVVVTADAARSGVDDTTTAAVAATSAAAGATYVRTGSGDPRATRESVDAVSNAQPARVIGVGNGLGDPQRLSARVAAAATGVQLPGGGQLPAQGKQYIALYGHPGTPVLGVLGEQDLEGSVRRAKEQAAAYNGLTDRTVVPMFEIITTMALGDPSPNGNYTRELDPEALRPWVERAQQEGIYVVLDLQPGRADLLVQAKKYEPLLRYPHVGLALDPEWKLRPDQRPLRQIGQVQADEVNRVGDWLSALTRDNHLPQKLFVLHQFQTRMLPDRAGVRTDHDELQTLIHVDGQGAQPDKQATWAVITQDPPPGVVWGWKNFHDEDQPMLTPQQTIERVDPTPVMISYQ